MDKLLKYLYKRLEHCEEKDRKGFLDCIKEVEFAKEEVDQILIDIDNISIAGGYTGRSVNIAGTNTAPSAASAAAIASLIVKGFTVTTS